MNCYIYKVFNEQSVIKAGTVHATSDLAAKARIEKEVLPKVSEYTNITCEKSNCQECNGSNDVASGYVHGKQFVLCQDCRRNLIIQLKKRRAI